VDIQASASASRGDAIGERETLNSRYNMRGSIYAAYVVIISSLEMFELECKIVAFNFYSGEGSSQIPINIHVNIERTLLEDPNI